MNSASAPPKEKLISDIYWRCVDSFRLRFEYLQKKDDTIPDKLRGAVGQLRVWAENVGAHRCHGASLSFDHRLREALRFSSHVKHLLIDLDDVVKASKYPIRNEGDLSSVDNVLALAMVSGKLKIPVDDSNNIGDDDT
jgi:hypothetical protein